MRNKFKFDILKILNSQIFNKYTSMPIFRPIIDSFNCCQNHIEWTRTKVLRYQLLCSITVKYRYLFF